MNQDYNASKMFKFFNNFIAAYHKILHPLIIECNLPPMAVDILMFIANNPDNNTAKDICRLKGLKASIVSFHVDNLVNNGYLRREEVKNDRRKTNLVCTEKTNLLIAKGRELQKNFISKLNDGLSEEDILCFAKCLNVLETNITKINQEEN